jgi:CBS domain containing-hemolysin-like protein
LLHRVFSLSETEVRAVMVPRIDIVGIEREDPWSEVLDRVRSSEHARLPVYRETVDEVLGILYAKDLLPAVVADEEPEAGWQSLMREALFIPPTKPVDDQLREFRASGTHIAIVVDEYGGTAGLVTIEDVLEELVGEIRDENDEEQPEVEQEEGRRWWVSARLTLDELSELLEHDFRRESVSTVGGLIYDLLGRVPRAGEEIIIDNYRVVVERVVKRRVQRVYFERPDPTEFGAEPHQVERRVTPAGRRA